MDAASLAVKVGVKVEAGALEKLQSRLESINSKLRVIAGAEIIKGLFHLTENFGHSALELENTAAAAGLTTEAMQKLQFAVAQSGGNASELGMTMSHLSRMIQAAKLGGDEAITTFFRLGISQQTVASWNNTEDALFGVMDALRQIKDPIKQHALLDQALGQGSRGLGRFALAGSAAARATTKNAKAMGAIIPAATIRQLANAKASMDGLNQIVKALAGSIGGAFAPALMQAVKGVEGLYAKNRELIGTKIEEWVGKVSFVFGELYALTYLVVQAFVDFTNKHKALISAIERFGPALLATVVVLPRLIDGFIKLKQALIAIQLLWAAFSLETVIAAAGMVSLALILGTVAAGIASVYQVMKGGRYEDTPIAKMIAHGKEFGEWAQRMKGELAWRWEDIVGEFAGPQVEHTLVNENPTGRYDAPGSFGNGLPPLMDTLNATQYQINTPPAFLTRPSMTPLGGNQSFEPNIVSNVTINVPPGMTADDAKKAVSNGVKSAMDKDLAQAMQRFRDAHLVQ